MQEIRGFSYVIETTCNIKDIHGKIIYRCFIVLGPNVAAGAELPRQRL